MIFMQRQRFAIKAWPGTNFLMSRCAECNRVLIKHCIKCCKKCWDDRNQQAHDKIMQRERAMRWNNNARHKVEHGRHPQVRKHALGNSMNSE